MDDSTPELWSIGHSNHPIEHMLDLLCRHGIEAVVDVRSRPYSRFAPQYRKDRLERSLPDAGIAYLHLGNELGGKPVRDDEPKAGLDYRTRIARPDFRSGIARLLALAGQRRTVLMCRERDPLDCHRTHLICRYLRRRVGPIHHILPDGTLEAHATTEQRLLERVSVDPLPLFEAAPATEEDPLERAYDRFWRYGA